MPSALASWFLSRGGVKSAALSEMRVQGLLEGSWVVISRVTSTLNKVEPVLNLVTLLITHLYLPTKLQVQSRDCGFYCCALGSSTRVRFGVSDGEEVLCIV